MLTKRRLKAIGRKFLVTARLKMWGTSMTIWAKRVRKIKPYPAIPTEVKDYFLEPSEYVDDVAVMVVVCCACGIGFILGFIYGLLLG